MADQHEVATGQAAAISVVDEPSSERDETSERFHWTARVLLLSLALFLIAAATEVGGGWLIWQVIREGRPWWWALLGSLVLILYGFVPTWQPISNFGRIFAVYGGFFIVYSYGWGWALDEQRPDTGTAVKNLRNSWAI